ncbi:sister-chromatid cohesion protein 3-like [Pyrus x bretschneideri]|uniref:sister-chromatid cohesion protein 3-like n=1 Tax=Pyrus x bretschneideri TaxID=225117 RepID=UPI00202E429E|nr:sister-chromatid cohesion protein 3-like [Pyrus x bretschneideri]
MKEFNNFKDNLQCLWDTLVGECQHGPLFDQILLKCMDYITALSRSPRTYRQAATWRALQLITSFISVANTLATRRETTRIQLNAEQKIETEGHRVESLNKRLSMTHDKITTLEQMMCKIPKGLFVHCYRYREIDPNIWISCTESLFLQDVYLQYIGLALKDKRAGARIAFVHALKNHCEIDANVPSLGRFTRRFSSQMITLSGDIDISVAISETDLVKQLLLR